MAYQPIATTMQKFIAPVKNLFLVLAATSLALMMFLTALDVGLRYIFNRPISGALELVEYFMAVLVPFALTITAFKKAHIGVELIMERFSAGVRRYVACATHLAVTALYALITWQSFLYIFEQQESGMTSAVLLIPNYPFVASLTAAFALLSLIALMHFIEKLTEVVTQWTHS
jgi:TRAP-type C4-dicarboxylate transport system permease small subunit